MKKLYSLKVEKVLIPSVVLLCVFLLAGGFSALQSYAYGAQSYSDYIFNTIAPFFAGFILIGAFGLIYAYRRRGSWHCLLGFGISIFCYCGIEILYQAAGGI